MLQGAQFSGTIGNVSNEFGGNVPGSKHQSSTLQLSALLLKEESRDMLRPMLLLVLSIVTIFAGHVRLGDIDDSMSAIASFPTKGCVGSSPFFAW
jgi:hypothetical protein